VYLYFFSKEEGCDIRGIVRGGSIVTGDMSLRLSYMLDATPGVFGRAIEKFDSYLEFLSRTIGPKLEGKKVVVWFSGGKDSTTSLIVLLKLQEYISLNLRVYYIHAPLLDGRRNLSFVDEVSRRLNIDIEIESIGREKMEDLLWYFGMPFRGFRWCTYHAKIRPMREIRRRLGFDYEVSSERLFESYKRFESLQEYAKRKMFISGRQLKPTYFFTILDVVDILKKHNAIHPDYLRGCSRVSCSICPYRTIFELEETIDDLEDPGLIESILRKTFLERYKHAVGWEDYLEFSLWRFSPKMVGGILRLKQLVHRMGGYITSEDIRRALSTMWHTKFDAPKLELDEITELMLEAYRTRKYGILNLGLEPIFLSTNSET